MGSLCRTHTQMAKLNFQAKAHQWVFPCKQKSTIHQSREMLPNFLLRQLCDKYNSLRDIL